MTQKLFIKTYGCQMNVYDSARMAELLTPLGYAETSAPDDADLIIINTCHIREHAAEKVFSELGRLRPLKEEKNRRGGKMTIAVAGCVAQAEGAEIQARMPIVDIVLGPQAYHRLPEMVAQATRAGGRQLDCDFPAEPKFDFLPLPTADGPSAFLSVQEGCDKFCTFCVVPYTRGSEYSRPAAAILADARHLVSQGVVEITLLGQNVNAWHGDGPDGKPWSLGRLIRVLAEIDGLARIRYTTSHPLDMDDDLIAAQGEVAALMPYLHLPVQSGSDRILAAMNRKHKTDIYYTVVDKLRTAKPDLALSSDFIVGFPGETDADFEDTLRLVERVGFGAGAYSFKYSARPGTPAAQLPGQLSEKLKEERLARLQALLVSQAAAFNQSMVGRTLPVLFVRPGRRPGQLIGKSPYLQSVHLEAPPNWLNTIREVRVVAATGISLAGALEGETAAA